MGPEESPRRNVNQRRLVFSVGREPARVELYDIRGPEQLTTIAAALKELWSRT
jgi:hypothetical protein